MQNVSDKACFVHNMGYGSYKDLASVTASDNVLHDED